MYNKWNKTGCTKLPLFYSLIYCWKPIFTVILLMDLKVSDICVKCVNVLVLLQYIKNNYDIFNCNEYLYVLHVFLLL